LSFITNASNADDFEWRGYVSQTLVNQQSTNKVTPSALARNEIGAYASYVVSDNLSVRGMVSRIGEDDRQIRINYALADLTIVGTKYTEAGIRLGRIPYIMGFSNEQRNSPEERQMEFPIQSIYPDKFRYFMRSVEMGQLYSRYTNSNWAVDTELSYGKPQIFDPTEISEIFYLTPGLEFNKSSKIRGKNLTVTYYPTNTRVRIDFTDVLMNSNMFPIQGNTTQFSRYYGIDQTISNTNIKLEALRVDAFGDAFLRMTHGHQMVSFTDAITITQRLNDNWSVLISYDEGYTNAGDKDGRLAELYTGIPAARHYQDTKSAALIYRTGQWKIRGEYHNVNGTFMLSSDISNISKAMTKWEYSAFTVVYSFK
jgi:hypothetical protein